MFEQYINGTKNLLPLPGFKAGPMELIPGFAKFDLTLTSFYDKLLIASVSIAIVVAISLIASSGYTMMMSQGDSGKIKEAKAQIQDAIMGLVLILLAATVVRIVFSVLKIGVVTIN
jgi:hypothetical protein